jgi:anti-sigma B factor antagonist
VAWNIKEIEGEGQKALVELEGVVDSTNVDQFFGFINSVFKQGIARIVLDLEYTSYLSSGGLSVIVDAFKRADREGGKLVVARASITVKELFEVVQFEQIMEFYDDLDEAIAAV